MPSLLHDHLYDDLKKTNLQCLKEGRKWHWEKWAGKTKWSWDVSCMCLLLRFPSVGLCPGFATVCKQGAETDIFGDKLGLELVCGEDLPGFASADQTHESEQPKHELWCWHGGKGQSCHAGTSKHPWVTAGRGVLRADGCVTLREAADKAMALVRLPGKKVYTVKEIIFHLPAGQLVLGRVFSVWDLRICRQTNSMTQQRSV